MGTGNVSRRHTVVFSFLLCLVPTSVCVRIAGCGGPSRMNGPIEGPKHSPWPGNNRPLRAALGVGLLIFLLLTLSGQQGIHCSRFTRLRPRFFFRSLHDLPSETRLMCTPKAPRTILLYFILHFRTPHHRIAGLVGAAMQIFSGTPITHVPVGAPHISGKTIHA